MKKRYIHETKPLENFHYKDWRDCGDWLGKSEIYRTSLHKEKTGTLRQELNLQCTNWIFSFFMKTQLCYYNLSMVESCQYRLPRTISVSQSTDTYFNPSKKYLLELIVKSITGDAAYQVDM
jgi:hypothetical protein